MTLFEPKDRNFEQRVRDSFDRQQVMSTLGIKIANLVEWI